MSNGTHSSGSASELQRAIAAARELSDALWDSLQQELSQASYQRARALAAQLGEIASTITLLVDEGHRAPTPTGAAEQALAESATTRAVSTRAPQAQTEHIPKRPDASTDEHQPVERRMPPEPIPPPAFTSDFDPGIEEHSRGQLVDEQELARVMPFAPVDGDGSGQSQIAIRDGDRDEDSAAWISSVGKSLVRHAEDHLPFAVLLVEIVEVAHLERSATPHDLHAVVAQVESALARGMRTVDELSRETLGRYWLLAPDTNDTGARMLAERLAQLVRDSVTDRGQPMGVAIGIAVCPQDGTEAPTLTATADLGVYTARLTGRSVVHTEPPQH